MLLFALILYLLLAHGNGVSVYRNYLFRVERYRILLPREVTEYVNNLSLEEQNYLRSISNCDNMKEVYQRLRQKSVDLFEQAVTFHETVNRKELKLNKEARLLAKKASEFGYNYLCREMKNKDLIAGNFNNLVFAYDDMRPDAKQQFIQAFPEFTKFLLEKGQRKKMVQEFRNEYGNTTVCVM